MSTAWRNAGRAFCHVANLSLIAVLLLAWRNNGILTRANERLRNAHDEVLAGLGRPVLIHGFSIPILDYVNVVDEHVGSASTTVRRKVLLFYKTPCGACEVQLPVWLEFVSDARFQHVETWLIRFGTDDNLSDQLRSTLKRRNLSYRLMSVKDPTPFAVATGVDRVPVTIVTQGETDAVELVVAGVADKPKVDFILHALTGVRPRPGTHVLLPGVAESGARE